MDPISFDDTAAEEPIGEHHQAHQQLGMQLSDISQQRSDQIETQYNELRVRSQVLYNELYISEQHNSLVRGVMRYLRTFKPESEVEIAKPQSNAGAGVTAPTGMGALVLTKDGFRIHVAPEGYSVLEGAATQ